MGSIKHLIFDFDGTLADTLPVMIRALGNAFRKHDGRELDFGDFNRMSGPSELGIIRLHLQRQEFADAAIEEFVAEYELYHEEMVEKNEEIASLLRDLHDAGAGLALFTGKSRRTLDISLAKLGLALPFDRIVTGDDVAKSKPSPEGILQILDALGWNREDTVFVGDSNDDMRAGRDAGVRTFAAQWMPTVQAKEYPIPPERVFASLGEFRSYLAEHVPGFLR
ncbi:MULTISPECIES: HAD family hydrolase [Cohnella]|uniref:HAD family hydrolase n=1 Tax=Cohnella TaxID=329857 RepID=UPI0009BA9A8D|nr:MULTISPECIES: HAD family hydrolase [Cohnella]MBN2980214.1 HAD family hydrolase [Cohnella algarum]